MFTKILIANRGEIACRIIRTARDMGIQTVAVYSTADTGALHVREADEACCIGEAPAKESYLNIQALIKAAQDSGAQAIHPGYGFLSENPAFAKACSEAGLVFIGPSVAAMEAMSSKQGAKQLLENSTVPLTPGYHGEDQNDATLLKAAKKIGFPVLLKAASGGGGKGMRAVDQESEFLEALAGARREAKSSFGDEIMIIEKLIESPRHIEVQIMADSHGQVVHLFERDCSIQRRHQKIIEEAPAPGLSDTLREKLYAAACEVAKKINYLGAGTVEFLLSARNEFYFMEMNTRLQVEHPVTEMITGLDLVRWQILIAAGQPLPLQQSEIKAKGHAIECRLCAEDPEQQFMPSIGSIHFLRQPKGQGLRLDSGIEQGSLISRYYDPMFAKLISYGVDRQEAIARMQQGLAHFYLSGVKTNLPFLQAILKEQAFIQGQLTTHFLSDHPISIAKPDLETLVNLAAAYDYAQLVNSLKDPLWQDTFAWQGQQASWTWRYIIDQKLVSLSVQPGSKQHFTLQWQDHKPSLRCDLNQDRLTVFTAGNNLLATVDDQGQVLHFFTQAGHGRVERFRWDAIDSQASGQAGQLTAPMPATVVAVLKKIGEKVKAGDRLMVLEAMKMEHTIHAPRDGILVDLFFNVGSQVNEGAELLTLSEPTE